MGVSGEIHGQATLGVEKDPALSGPCEQELAHAKEQSFASYDIWLNNDELLVRLPVPEAYNGRSIEVLHCTTEGVETLTALANDGMVQVSVSALGTFLLRLPGEKDAQPVTPVSQVPATGGAAYGALLLLPAVSLLAFVMQRKGFLNKKEE